MGFVSDWTDSAREVITSPAEFFENEDRRDGFGYPLKFAAFSLLIAGIFRGINPLIYGTAANVQMSGAAAAGMSFAISLVGGLIGLFIGAGLIHIFVYLFGGENGYGETLATLEYATAITAAAAVLGLVPVLGGLIGLLMGLYAIYVQAKGLEAFQELSFGKGLASVILPGIILALVVFGLTVTVLSASMLAGGM